MISARMTALDGHSSDGFNTMVLPAAIQGATLALIWLTGQFHGVMRPTTPIGSCSTRALPISSSKLKSFSALAAERKWPRPAGACAAVAKLIGAPISSLIACAMSPMRFLYSSAIRASSSIRSAGLVWEKLANAFRAALTALSTSALVPSVMAVTASSVAGLITS